MFLPHFDVFCDLLLNRRTTTWNLFVLYSKETNYHLKSFFLSKSFNMTRKLGLCPALCPLWQTRRKVIWRNLLSIQMKQSHWLLCGAKEFWLVINYDLSDGWTSRWRRRNLNLFLCYLKRIDSMLSCVCSVIDYRRRQNVVRTPVTHSAIASCANFLFLPHFDVICDLILTRRTPTWNLFVR